MDELPGPAAGTPLLTPEEEQALGDTLLPDENVREDLPDDGGPLQPWHRQEAETARDYELFSIYLSQDKRSIAALARNAEVSRQYAYRVAKENNWRSRVTDYDAWSGEMKAREIIRLAAAKTAEQAAIGGSIFERSSEVLLEALEKTHVEEDGTLRGLSATNVIKAMTEAGKMFREATLITKSMLPAQSDESRADVADYLLSEIERASESIDAD